MFARASRHRPYAFGGWTWDHWDIYITGARGTGLRRLTDQAFYQINSPRFSQDGHSVVFGALTSDSTDRNIYTVTTGTTPTLRPLTHDGHSSDPVPTPDGASIIYLSDAAVPFEYELWRMDRDGGHPRQLTHQHSYLANPAVTSDGRHLLALSDPDRAGRFDLYEFDADGTHPRRLADSSLFDDPLHWKPAH